MKTMEELYQEVLGSDELKGAFAQAVSEGRIEEFLKENGCEASPEEVKAFLQEKQAKEGELSEAELDAVSGGCSTIEAVASVVTAGIACAYIAIGSAIEGNMNGPDGAILCNYDGKGWV